MLVSVVGLISMLAGWSCVHTWHAKPTLAARATRPQWESLARTRIHAFQKRFFPWERGRPARNGKPKSGQDATPSRNDSFPGSAGVSPALGIFQFHRGRDARAPAVDTNTVFPGGVDSCPRVGFPLRAGRPRSQGKKECPCAKTGFLRGHGLMKLMFMR